MLRSGDVLERFSDALVQQISVTHPEYLTAPFTVAEIYQDLVPYQSHRDRIGVEMNGDYEDALFRMLSGEGDCLLLDSEIAVREMRAELERSNPNTALFHEYAALDVRLHPSRVPQVPRRGGGAEPGVEDETPRAAEMDAEAKRIDSDPAQSDVDQGGPDADQSDSEAGRIDSDDGEIDSGADKVKQRGQIRAEVAGVGAAASDASSDPQAPEVVGHIETAAGTPLSSFQGPPPETDSTEAKPSDELTVCHWCREDLPVRESVHFCPFCGSDLRPSPCRECGEAMEARWQFCASCGTDVRG